jgi:chromosome segregation ATPase
MKYLLFVTLLTTVSCGKKEPVGQLAEGLPKLTEGVGEYLETVGRIPRQLGNAILGTSDDTDNDLDELEDKVDANYELMLQMFSEVDQELFNLESEVDSNYDYLVGELQDQYDDLTDQIEEGDEKNASKIRRNLERIRNLRSKVRRIASRVRRTRQQVRDLRQTVRSLLDQLEDSQADIDLLESAVASNEQRLAELESDESISELIDPCGDNVGEFDEVIFKTQQGKYLSYFEDGGRRFLAELPDGNYRTTDRQQCRFTISNGVYSE